MRLMLDQAIPASVISVGDHAISFERWQLDAISDAALIAAAQQKGCDGVVFLGPSVLVRPDAVRAASDAHLLIVATSTEDPVNAHRDIAAHRNAIVSADKGADVLLVLSDRVRSMTWDEVGKLA